MLKTILAVGCGGFAGSVLRYLLTRFTSSFSSSPFPLGTLAVNLIGCLVLGMLSAMFNSPHTASSELKTFLTVGMCGGFTTFSTFNADSFALLRDGQAVALTTYIGASLVGGFALFAFGYMLVSRVKQ